MTKYEMKINDVECYLLRKHGTIMTEKIIAPLKWYVYTSRASVDFLNKLVNAKTFIIARQLEKGGGFEPYDSVIEQLKKKLVVD